MPKVKMRTLMAGPDGAAQVGQIIDMDDARAQELIDGGYAERWISPEEAAALKLAGETDANGDAATEFAMAPPAKETAKKK